MSPSCELPLPLLLLPLLVCCAGVWCAGRPGMCRTLWGVGSRCRSRKTKGAAAVCMRAAGVATEAHLYMHKPPFRMHKPRDMYAWGCSTQELHAALLLEDTLHQWAQSAQLWRVLPFQQALPGTTSPPEVLCIDGLQGQHLLQLHLPILCCVRHAAAVVAFTAATTQDCRHNSCLRLLLQRPTCTGCWPSC